MPRRPPQDEDNAEKGAPKWMVTFGDAVTLLLTFFVLMLTFSSPEPEHFQQLARGFFEGTSPLGAFSAPPPARDLHPDQRRLMSSRLDVEGAEKPPMYTRTQLEDLQEFYPNLDLDKLPDLGKSLVVRVPLKDMFGAGGYLSPEGKAVLADLTRILLARPCRLIVRTRPGAPGPQQLSPARAVERSVRVVQHLRTLLRGIRRDLRISNDVRLAEPPLPEGRCELIVLEG